MQEKKLLVCPICDGEIWENIFKIDKWDIQECSSCGFAKINPMPLREKRQEDYCEEKVVVRNTKKRTASKKISGALKSFFGKLTKRSKSKIFFDKFCKHLVPGARILDVGCGDGSFLKIAKSRFSCSGIEISKYLADLAKEDKDVKIFVGNFLDTELGQAPYDGICMISLLEHLDSPLEALKKCFDRMQNNGVLLLKTVNYSCLNCKIKGKDWTGFRPPDHVVYFTPKNLKKALQKIGFRKIRISSWPFNDNMYCDAFK